jgi:MoxR-like ATPase
MNQVLNQKSLKYTGKVQPRSDDRSIRGRPLSPYLPSSKLVDAVNLAMLLKRPLLLKGEPGCGKTQLASAVSFELSIPIEAWYIKSTSRARDGLYTYDAVGRLRDAQLAAAKRLSDEQLQKIDDPSTYVRWGSLGRAFLQEQRTVVLIDEIDKADIDFPNDLLLELDEQRFVVEETGQEIVAKVPPIILITSNDEKDLPDAFLRRCLFHYVEFPNEERLVEILRARFPEAPAKLVVDAVDRFWGLRGKMQKAKGEMGKKVSTSELIDWFQVLQTLSEDEARAHLNDGLPFAEVLLKSREDHSRYGGSGNRG